MEVELSHQGDGSWLIRDTGCYAIVRKDGTHKTFAKGGKVPDEVHTVVLALSDWCRRQSHSDVRAIPSGRESR
jgi:hypothetical protein